MKIRVRSALCRAGTILWALGALGGLSEPLAFSAESPSQGGVSACAISRKIRDRDNYTILPWHHQAAQENLLGSAAASQGLEKIAQESRSLHEHLIKLFSQFCAVETSARNLAAAQAQAQVKDVSQANASKLAAEVNDKAAAGMNFGPLIEAAKKKQQEVADRIQTIEKADQSLLNKFLGGSKQPLVVLLFKDAKNGLGSGILGKEKDAINLAILYWQKLQSGFQKSSSELNALNKGMSSCDPKGTCSQISGVAAGGTAFSTSVSTSTGLSGAASTGYSVMTQTVSATAAAISTAPKAANGKEFGSEGIKGEEKVLPAHTFDDKLNPSQRSALRGYLGSDYSSMNAALRNGEPCSSCKDASDALDHLPHYDGTTYRGVKAYDPQIAQKYTQEGAIVSDPGFLSTSRSPSTALSFSGGGGDHALLLVIDGNGGSSVENFSPYSNEKEVLYPPNTRFRVDSVTYSTTGARMVHLVQVH